MSDGRNYEKKKWYGIINPQTFFGVKKQMHQESQKSLSTFHTTTYTGDPGTRPMM